MTQACPKCNTTLINKSVRKGWHCYKCKEQFQAPLVRESKQSWTKKKRGRLNIWTPAQVEETIYQIKNVDPGEIEQGRAEKIIRDNHRAAAFLALLYLTGARVSEITSPLQRANNQGKIQDGIYGNKSYPEAIKKINFEIIKNEAGEDEFCLIYNIKTLKTRSKQGMKRTIPIDLKQSPDGSIFKVFKDYATKIGVSEAPLFKLTPRGANHIISKKTKKFPHFFRHCRLSHLVQHQGYNAMQLKKFTGWKTIAPTDIYVNLDISDLLETMRKSRKKEIVTS